MPFFPDPAQLSLSIAFRQGYASHHYSSISLRNHFFPSILHTAVLITQCIPILSRISSLIECFVARIFLSFQSPSPPAQPPEPAPVSPAPAAPNSPRTVAFEEAKEPERAVTPLPLEPALSETDPLAELRQIEPYDVLNTQIFFHNSQVAYYLDNGGTRIEKLENFISNQLAIAQIQPGSLSHLDFPLPIANHILKKHFEYLNPQGVSIKTEGTIRARYIKKLVDTIGIEGCPKINHLELQMYFYINSKKGEKGTENAINRLADSLDTLLIKLPEETRLIFKLVDMPTKIRHVFQKFLISNSNPARLTLICMGQLPNKSHFPNTQEIQSASDSIEKTREFEFHRQQGYISDLKMIRTFQGISPDS